MKIINQNVDAENICWFAKMFTKKDFEFQKFWIEKYIKCFCNYHNGFLFTT